MGCKCANGGVKEEEIRKNPLDSSNQNEENIGENLGINNQEEELENIQEFQNPNLKYLDYPQKIVELINNIRTDPVGYADIIEESIGNIIEEIDKNNPNNKRLIFKKKVKVALNRGEVAFREAAELLRSLSPLPPLEFRSEKCIPLPESEEEIKDVKFLREQVKKVRKQTEIDVFFKDLIKLPEVSALLMIVDDTSQNAGKKRMTLLNKELKYIGVSCKFFGKTFIAYFGFSK